MSRQEARWKIEYVSSDGRCRSHQAQTSASRAVFRSPVFCEVCNRDESQRIERTSP